MTSDPARCVMDVLQERGGRGDGRIGRWQSQASRRKPSARPRQIRSVDARPEEMLRAAKAADRGVQSLPEIGQIIRRTVGERLVSLGPDVLRRIEFGRVRREVMDMQTRMLVEERSDLAPPVDRAAVPQQVDGAAQMSEQMV